MTSHLSNTTKDAVLGGKEFFELTPDRVLGAVESLGWVCTGRCLTLNSMENRVYEVELDSEDLSEKLGREARSFNLSERSRVVKFYRPGRWTKEQILEEHEFLSELENVEIPVIAPIKDSHGVSLFEEAHTGIFFTLFPKMGGRAPDEFNTDQLHQLGRLLARIHLMGRSHPAKHRLFLNPETYGLKSLEVIKTFGNCPPVLWPKLEAVILKIVETSRPHFERARFQRIHGDCHRGNLLWSAQQNDSKPFFLDFDDMVMGPPVQDIWMTLPGRDEESLRQRDTLLRGYETMAEFDFSSLKLVEPLRALRMIHFCAWITRRWGDPTFKHYFSYYGSEHYWAGLIQDLNEQFEFLS